MPYIQIPTTTGPIHGTQQYVRSSRSSSFAEVSSSSSCTESPFEAIGDIPPRQETCIVEHTSAYVDSLARARVIAVTALNIFVYDKPLNAHRDRWICPFSNCKQPFSDPKAMLSHAAKCTHVSANGAYCNCCGYYYDFPGQNPACPARAGDSAPTIAKDSAMAKGKRKFHELFSRRSGSASSSREQLSSKARWSFAIESGMESPPTSRKGSVVSDFIITGSPSGSQPSVGAAELCADARPVEIGNSSIVPSYFDFTSGTDSTTPQRSSQSTVSTVSTMGSVAPMIPDCGEICMSPTEYSVQDVHYNTTQQPRNDSVSYSTGEVAFCIPQHFQDGGDQGSSWNFSVGQIEAEAFNFGEFIMSSQESQESSAPVPNFSRPRLPPASAHSVEAPPSVSHYPNGREDAIPLAMAHSYHDDEEFLGITTTADQNIFEVGEAYGDLQQSELPAEPLLFASFSTRPSPRSTQPNRDDASELRCPDCEYRPQGDQANRKANFKKHRKIHEERIPLTCTQCGNKYTRSDNLLVHQRDVCGKKRKRQC